jgi:type III secretion system FlhB-like substrate exporter
MTDRQNKAAAIRYRHGQDRAPQVTAAGRGQVAEKIIALARAHGVPIHEDRNLVHGTVQGHCRDPRVPLCDEQESFVTVLPLDYHQNRLRTKNLREKTYYKDIC